MSKHKELIEKRRHLFTQLAAMELSEQITANLGSYEKAISERNMIYRAFNYLARNPDYAPEFSGLKAMIKASITQKASDCIIFTLRTDYEIQRTQFTQLARELPDFLKDRGHNNYQVILFLGTRFPLGNELRTPIEAQITIEMLQTGLQYYRDRYGEMPYITIEHSHQDEETSEDVWVCEEIK